MEGVETVDVSWLHHSQKDHLSRCKSASSTVSDRSSTDAEATGTRQPPKEKNTPSNANPPPPQPAPSESDVKPKENTESDAQNGDKAADPKQSSSPSAFPKSSPKPIGRRNSWISSISSKFSSGSTPPSQPNPKANNQLNPKASSPASKLDFHNPFGAAYSPKDKEEEDKRKEESNTVASTSPKGPSFLTNAFRKLSSGSGGFGKSAPTGTICQRRVMNIDQNRDRCKIPDLDQAKLRRVAFCVDVEIAGFARRESEDEGNSPSNGQRQTQESAASPQKAKRSSSRSKEKEEATALKNPQAAVVDKEKKDHANDNEKSNAPSETSTADAKANGETKEPSRKQEKKKRSEEERRERKERKRRQAEANGSIPLQLRAEDDLEDTRIPPPSGVPRSKAQTHPTTDPVRIYRRCCQLRETPVLKRVVDQISSPSSTLAESPGTVAVLDLSNFPMTTQDTETFCDWLAVVPVRKLILENCALTDVSVRAILAGLLSTKTVEQMRNRRRRIKNAELSTSKIIENYGVVEKLSLKDNPKIGREGWRHISLFIHLSRSLKAIDLSGIPFPKPPVAAINDMGQPACPQKPILDIGAVFSKSLAERFGRDHLEELLLSECKPATEDVQKICDAAIMSGLKRLGFANNELTREGLEHVIRYFEAGNCEGLDLGGNAIQDHLDLFTSAIEPDHPLYALSLADCSLTPSVIYPLLQGLTRLPNLRFIDFSHNRGLFSTQPDALASFRRFLPKMPFLKRIHLADVNLSADHTIALAEVLPECPSLCHLNILENPSITKLASANDPASQEEACAVYASLMAAVRVSRTMIALDIEVPSAESNEVVKALASQIVAYCLQNLERGAIEEELSDPMYPLGVRANVPVPEILQHIVGLGGDEPGDEEDEPAPDEDYVIGGTGVVKALGVCLGALDHQGSDIPGDYSVPPSGTTTPRHRRSKTYVTKKPRDMSKNLLESARNIRTRIQSALVREDRAGNEMNYRRLQFLDLTLHGMIQRFEDQYPETRIVPPPAPLFTAHETSSQNSGDDLNGSSVAENNGNGADNECAIDDEDADQYAVRLSRASSITSLHSRAMTSEEGHVHRLGQNLRRDFLSPSLNPDDGDDDDSSVFPMDDSHVASLREKLDRLHEEQTQSHFESGPHFESVGADKAFQELGSTVEELWAAQRQDLESFEKFKQSQIAAQINSGKRSASPMPIRGKE